MGLFDQYLSLLCCAVLSCLVMSYSLQPHGLQPARLLCPWDFPGKNSGVVGKGSLALLQGNLPNPGIELGSPALQVDSLPAEPPGKPIHQSNLCLWGNEDF